MNASCGRDVVASTVPSATISLPVESIMLPAPRAVSDGAGDGATVRRNDAYRREGDEIDGGDEGDCYPGNRRSQIETDPDNRGVIPQCPSERTRFARRGGNRGAGREDEDDTVGRREPHMPDMSGRMLMLARRSPYLMSHHRFKGDTDAGYGKSADTRDTDRFDRRCRYGMSSYLRFRLPHLPPRSNGFGFETLAESCHFFSALFSSSWFVNVFLCICIHAANSGSAYVR